MDLRSEVLKKASLRCRPGPKGAGDKIQCKLTFQTELIGCKVGGVVEGCVCVCGASVDA